MLFGLLCSKNICIQEKFIIWLIFTFGLATTRFNNVALSTSS